MNIGNNIDVRLCKHPRCKKPFFTKIGGNGAAITKMVFCSFACQHRFNNSKLNPAYRGSRRTEEAKARRRIPRDKWKKRIDNPNSHRLRPSIYWVEKALEQLRFDYKGKPAALSWIDANKDSITADMAARIDKATFMAIPLEKLEGDNYDND